MERLKDLVAWASQHGYFQADLVAEELGKLIGEELVQDQPYYNTYKWIKKENK